MSRRMVDRWEDDNKSYLKLNIKNRIYPTLYGLVIGDCLGVPVEFKKRGTFTIADMEGYGTYNQPKGTWSDDSSLTFCLMENIVENGDEASLLRKFVKYKEEGYLTPYGAMFDIGNTTIEAVNRFLGGSSPSQCGGKEEYDNGNGALMRIAPLAFILCSNFNFIEKCNVIKKYTELTHAHPRSIVGSIIYIQLLIAMYLNNSINLSISGIEKLFKTNFNENHVYRKELESYKRIFQDGFFDLKENEIKSSGYVVDTLEAAIWCLGTTKTFEGAVLKAVNLGGDTDTIASITGSLAGIYYKMDAIPGKWIRQIASKEKVDELINRFMLYCANQAVIKEYGEL